MAPRMGDTPDARVVSVATTLSPGMVPGVTDPMSMSASPEGVGGTVAFTASLGDVRVALSRAKEVAAIATDETADIVRQATPCACNFGLTFQCGDLEACRRGLS